MRILILWIVGRAEITLGDRVLVELAWGPAKGDLAPVEQDDLIGHLDRPIDVLLDKEERGAFGRDPSQRRRRWLDRDQHRIRVAQEARRYWFWNACLASG
jgi:hypothetical protein